MKAKRKIAFYPYEGKNSKSLNLCVKNIEKVLEKEGHFTAKCSMGVQN